jgi:uncharacterized protein (TIGR02217 family)
MTASEARFPEDISYGSSGGPTFSTSIVSNVGGYEKRNQHWENARAIYNVAHGIKTKAQLSALIVFFRARKGRSQAFRFKDWMDFEAIGEIIGTGNGVQTQFQLIKTYASGENTCLRSLSKPVDGTVRIYFNNALQSNGYIVNYTTGIITFASAPASGVIVQADCEFDVPVRFETDQLSARLEEYGVYSWADIPLVEVRV